MKNLAKKVFLVIAIVLIIALLGETFGEFMSNHTYYNDMFSSWSNWGLIIGAIISAGIPLLYLLFNKKFSLKNFIIWLVVGLLVFSFVHIGVNKSFQSNGLLIFIVNILILFVLGAWFITGTLALGTWISKFINFKENRIQEMFLKFGIGLGAILILVEILIGFKLFFPVLTWIIFLGLGFMIWYMREDLKGYAQLLGNTLSNLNLNKIKENRWNIILIVLAIFSIIYYLYGFQLSFIPYSTAWDANHAYMYTPKVIAENHGLLRGNVGTAGAMPYLWYMFITFWFSIGSIFSGGWLSPDTIAVAMNFLSGPLCLFFGLGLINEIVEYFCEKKKMTEKGKTISFGAGWMTLLLWLTSGMGAFLVFVDNKTDLGVMALTILAILSGIIFIRYIGKEKSKGKLDKNALKYIITSGVFFALAGMAKPSAFIDMVVFGLLLVALWIDEILSLGLGIISIGLMGILQVQNAFDFMTPSLGIKIVILGFIISCIGVAIIFVKKSDKLNEKKELLSYAVIRGISLFATLLVFKGPWLAYTQISNNEFGLGNFGKGLFMSYQTDNKISDNKDSSKKMLLLTQTESFEDLQEQNEIDSEFLEGMDTADTSSISVEACLDTEYSDEELEEGMLEAEVTNEDVGRYVGYGWKDFGSNPGRLTYNLLHLFYHKDGKCYGFNKDGKVLCRYQNDIVAGNISKLEELQQLGLLKKGGVAEGLLNSGLAEYAENEDTLMDLIADLKTYYQNNSIYVENGIINVPYKYLVPLNITFNWSLQNLSSYYTDIGFIWIFVYILLGLGFIYSIVKRDKKLFSLTMSTLVGRGIWWIIGGGILWYGIGLIIWTILVVVAFINELTDDKNDDWHNLLFMLLCIALGILMVVQIFFNFIRISSQGSSGPFLWFKQSAGDVQEISENLTLESSVKIPYSQKDVFDLQFPHYNKFIEYVADRKDEDGILIAGTYIQYFLKNQHNFVMDGSLNRFWEQGSDEDTCKMYHRLKNNNVKYLVIDPNIASIVMGEGNKSLFYRFFAKINDNGKIISKGAMFMLTQMINDGYMKFLYSNNIGAKYAYTLTDNELISLFGEMSKDELIYLRAQMASARYMDNANELINYIAQILGNRLLNGQAIGDIADIYGKVINEEKVFNAVNVWLQSKGAVSQIVETLNQDERFILYNYLSMYMSIQQDTNAYSEIVNNLLSSSIAGGSQLMVFELK